MTKEQAEALWKLLCTPIKVETLRFDGSGKNAKTFQFSSTAKVIATSGQSSLKGFDEVTPLTKGAWDRLILTRKPPKKTP